MALIRRVGVAAAFFALLTFGRSLYSASPQAPQNGAQGAAHGSPADKMTADDIAQGKQLFAAQCSGCHGFDASGGLGPDLHGVAQRRGDQGIFSAIRNGIPGTAMPPVMSLNDQRAWQVVAYVRTLGSTGAQEAIKGDPVKGQAVYEANGCATCHAINGQGGGVGPQLSAIGKSRVPKYLHDVLLNPGASPPEDASLPERSSYTGYLVTHVVTKDGKDITGIRVNEDSFTIQLRDVGGHFYSFNKNDLQKLETQPGKSVMPGFSNLSATDLDDLVAYLASLKGAQ